MKKIKRLFLTSVLLYLLIFIVSCDARPYSSKSSDYFKYKIDVDTKEVVLVGLTEKGEEQETVVIPSIIDGKKVSRIGYLRRSFCGSYWDSNFKSDKLKTIYFPSGFSKSETEYGFYRNIPNIENVFWGDINIASDFYNHVKKITIISYENYKNNTLKYQKNYSWVTYKVVNVIPPTPYRAGYKFTNWYKEKECINLWNFEKDKVPKIKYDSDGNEIYEEVKIYAGWEEK